VLSSAELKDRQKRHWDQVADGWATWLEWSERSFKPVTDWLQQAVDWRPGIRALDIGCGAGYPSLAAARLVAPGGSVVAIDISQKMLTVAAAAARRARLDNVTFLEMDAERLDLDDRSFDAVTNTYGLMFCPNAAHAVAEAHRVLVPGGRFGAVVWDRPSNSPYFSVIANVANRQLGLQPPPHDAPGPFRFAEPAAVESLFRHAGFAEVRVEICAAAFECASADEYCRMFGDLAWRSKIAGLSSNERSQFISALDEEARPYTSGGRLRLIASSLCCSGVK
jgi:ubiquinone/menaquinone biosynthesis C-methylase UbiE